MEKPEGLIPVKITSIYVQSPTIMGKLIRQDLIVTDKNQTVCADLPPSWMEYIKNAINGFASAQEYKRNDIPISTGILYSAKIPGMPVAMSDGKQIKKDNDGNFTLSASKEYARRIRQVMKMKMELTYGFSNKPIDYPVHVKCVFCINKKSKRIVVSEQVTATLDLLKRLGILRSDTSEVVARTDGSEVQYILNEPHTQVTIRKMREEE
jgi:hypothetical protein